MPKSEEIEADMADLVISKKSRSNSQVEASDSGPTSFNTVASKQEQSSSELDQLRQIVFGAAHANLDSRIDELRTEMHNGFKQINEALEQHISEVNFSIQESASALDDRISQVDDHYDSKVTEINNETHKLHDIVDANSEKNQQQDEQMHKRVEQDIDKLTNEFTQKHNQTIDLLNQMKKELNSSKTDRKTLAKLLASVASNLEIDDES